MLVSNPKYKNSHKLAVGTIMYRIKGGYVCLDQIFIMCAADIMVNPFV